MNGRPLLSITVASSVLTALWIGGGCAGKGADRPIAGNAPATNQAMQPATPVAAPAQAPVAAQAPAPVAAQPPQPVAAPTAVSVPTTASTAQMLLTLPTANAADAERVRQDLLRSAPQSVIDLVRQLQPEGRARYEKRGKEDPDPARYALHGLALHVARAGGDPAQRAMFAQALASQLDGDYPTEIRIFLIRQLQLVGDPIAAAPIAKALASPDLCPYAVSALTVMGKDVAAAPLREALPRVEGRNRLAVMQALGTLRDGQAVSALVPAVSDADLQTRLTAMWALANIGDAAAAEATAKAVGSEVAAERVAATDACLLLAQRLTESPSGKEQALQLYQRLWITRTATQERNVRCAALRGLVSLQGEKAMDQLMAAIDGDNSQVRAVAVELGRSLPGESATRGWMDRLRNAKAPSAAAILDLLGRRGDTAALPAASEAMKTLTDEQAFKAAVTAFAVLGKDQAVPRLVEMLSSEKELDRQAAQDALGKVPGEAATSALAQALTSSPSRVRVALLGVLPARGAAAYIDLIIGCTKDADAEVRKAAVQALGGLADPRAMSPLVEMLLKADEPAQRQQIERALASACRGITDGQLRTGPLVAAMPAASVPCKCAIVRVLADTGGNPALPALRAAVKDPEADVQDAAVRAMSSWWNPDLAPELLAIAQTATKPNQRILAYRGFVRLASTEWLWEDRRLDLLKQALPAAPRAEDRKQVFGGLSRIGRPEALKLAMDYLNDEASHEEAALAVVKIADRMQGRNDDRAAALYKAYDATKDENIRRQAADVLKRLGKPLPTTAPATQQG